MGLFFLNKGS